MYGTAYVPTYMPTIEINESLMSSASHTYIYISIYIYIYNYFIYIYIYILQPSAALRAVLIHSMQCRDCIQCVQCRLCRHRLHRTRCIQSMHCIQRRNNIKGKQLLHTRCTMCALYTLCTMYTLCTLYAMYTSYRMYTHSVHEVYIECNVNKVHNTKLCILRASLLSPNNSRSELTLKFWCRSTPNCVLVFAMPSKSCKPISTHARYMHMS